MEQFQLPGPNDCYGVIYCTTNLINGHKYIGQDSNNNPYYLGSGDNLNKAFKKYDRKNFKKEILQYCIDKEDLNESEIYWIDYFGAVQSEWFYNLSSGGDSFRKGTKWSEEVKNKIAVAHTGLKMHENTRQALLKIGFYGSRKGVKLSEETRRRISEGMVKSHLERGHHGK